MPAGLVRERRVLLRAGSALEHGLAAFAQLLFWAGWRWPPGLPCTCDACTWRGRWATRLT